MRPFNIYSRAVAALCLLVASSPAWAETDCAGCAAESARFPESTALLASHGFGPDQYTILMAWNEAGHGGAGPVAYGFRLAPAGGGAPFDLYTDADGALLNSEAMGDLGIEEKDWSETGRSAFTHWPRRSAAKAIPPRPASAALSAAGVPTVDVVPVDSSVWEQDDSLGKGLLRVGVVQALESPIAVEGAAVSHGAWHEVAGGWVWAATIQAEGAVGQRVHVRDLALPGGASVVVYNATNPADAYGPFTAADAGEDGLWAPTVFSERVTIECRVPQTVSRDAVRLAVEEISYVYRGFDAVPWQPVAKGPGTSGSCNIDVTCEPAWATEASGVAMITFLFMGFQAVCTGTLIADTDDSTDIPYFLTADHCIPNASTANSIEFFWFYQTSICNGPIPNPFTSPQVARTAGGADYLASSTLESGGNDFSLLRMRSDPPGGAAFVGWDAAAVPVGVDVVGVHHPDGDATKYCFGSSQPPSTDPFFPDIVSLATYIRVIWSEGTTEGGSSGSAMFRADTGQIVGQLYGGYASCAARSTADYYGRFELTLPVVAEFLDPASTEPAAEDIDGSGAVDAIDVQLVINRALGINIGVFNEPADVDKDGEVNAVDVQLVINAVLAG